MKFTKEEALEKLKSHLTNNGRKTLRMSERSLDGQLDTLIPVIATDEMELDDFFEKVKSSFEIMNSNAEKDKSDFVKEWKKTHPIKDEDSDGDKDNKNGSDVTPDKALLERITQLEQKIQAEETAKVIGQKRRELKAKMKEVGIADSDWSDMVLSEISITEDLDVKSKADSLLKLYNKQNASPRDVRTPRFPSGNNIDKDAFKEVVELKKKRDEQLKGII